MTQFKVVPTFIAAEIQNDLATQRFWIISRQTPHNTPQLHTG